MTVLEAIRNKLQSRQETRSIDIDSERLRLAGLVADGKEPTAEELEAAKIVAGQRNQRTCPNNPKHKATRAYSPAFVSEARHNAVCDDCGATWKHVETESDIPADAMTFDEFESLVQTVHDRRRYQQQCAALPQARKDVERLKAKQQKAIDVVSKAIEARDKVLQETAGELMLAEQTTQDGIKAESMLVAECRDPALTLERTRLQKQLATLNSKAAELRADLWGQGQPGFLDGVHTDGTGARALSMLRPIVSEDEPIRLAREKNPKAFEDGPRITPKIQKGFGYWFDPDQAVFRGVLKQARNDDHKGKHKKAVAAYRAFWASEFQPTIERWVATVDEARTVAARLQDVDDRMRQA